MQRSRLHQNLLEGASRSAEVGLVSTADGVQGGERPAVILSPTRSDPASIAAAEAFMVSRNRWNVMFSRAQERLFVICPESLLYYIPTEAEHYATMGRWKALPGLCPRQIASTQVDGHLVRIYAA